MASRKKTQRVWNLLDTGLMGPLSVTDQQFETVLMRVGDDDITGGPLRVHRLMGQLRVFVDAYTAGAVNAYMWHGVLACEDEENAGTQFMLNQLDDNATWLWREPIPVFTKMGRSWPHTDYSFSVEFDWPLRGGAGTAVEPGRDLRYVWAVVTNGNMTVSGQATLLSLLSST